MSSHSNQGTLFDDDTDPAAASSANALARSLVDGRSAQAQTRGQREFAKLSARVTELRRVLEAAIDLLHAYQSHVAKAYEPRWRDLLAARRDFVKAGDRVLLQQAALPKARRLGAKRRKHLADFIVLQAVDLIENGGYGDDAELAAIHDRHGDVTLDESRELEQTLAQSMLDGVIGPEAAKQDPVADFEALLHRAQEHFEAQAREREEQRRQRTKSRSGSAKAREQLEKREQAAKDVSRSVREVYRKLASALHPDRETDPAERERKNRLMQRANDAYERGDLLELLSMQISQIESDQAVLARADDKRFALYCQALREQQQALEQEISEVEAPIREGLRLAHGVRMPGRDAVFALVDRDAKMVAAHAEAARRDTAMLLDPKRCGAAIDCIPEADDEELFDAFVAAMGEAAMARPRGRRKRTRR
jgi:hypothetical protein